MQIPIKYLRRATTLVLPFVAPNNDSFLISFDPVRENKIWIVYAYEAYAQIFGAGAIQGFDETAFYLCPPSTPAQFQQGTSGNTITEVMPGCFKVSSGNNFGSGSKLTFRNPIPSNAPLLLPPFWSLKAYFISAAGGVFLQNQTKGNIRILYTELDLAEIDCGC